MFKTLFLLSFAIVCAFSLTHGVDLSYYEGSPAQSVFDCFKRNGQEFTVLQIWRGGYGINQYFTSNWQKSKAAGIKYVDAYAFFCNNCRDNTPANICSSIKKSLPSGFDGMLWLDVEDCTNCWTGTPAVRLAYVHSVAAACAAQGFKLGVYSGKGSWGQVFGSHTFDAGPVLKALPLWYAHYDNDPSLSDWSNVKFGGWTKPTIKQYAGDVPYCGVNSDLNVY